MLFFPERLRGKYSSSFSPSLNKYLLNAFYSQKWGYITESQGKVLDLIEVTARQGRLTCSRMKENIASMKEREAQKSLMRIESINRQIQVALALK